ncbi:iron-sulfur cluster assembly scaffold protein [Brucella pituitosa]|uniref:iron-sulfur cluster assembly scaffold protein n=1 Tax=Brucella pituitosa TaxID=571256 RepID=UPI003F4AA4E0
MTVDKEIAALYHRDLRDWATLVRNDKRLVPPDVSITRNSRTCGSSITLDIRRDEDLILEVGWRTRACTLGMASTAVVVRHAPGQSVAEVAHVAEKLRRLLAGENVSFTGQWEDLARFTAARDFPTRHNSIMLPFEALAGVDHSDRST